MRPLRGARGPRLRFVVLVAAILSLAAVAAAQFPWGGRGGRGRREPVSYEKVPYDGRFTFLRVSYDMGAFGGFSRRFSREPPWAHDYPRAERNFMEILNEVTTIRPFRGPEGGTVHALDEPEIFNFPLAYMSEPGFWNPSDEDVQRLRAYLDKGGFLIFDDFAGRDWYNLEEQMRRVQPEGRFVELDVGHPIFHSFFEIETLDFVQFYGRGARPVFYGMFEDNDPAKRLQVIANYNNDIGEYWEYSDTGFTPIELSNEAYKLGVNYVVYAMSH